jgi:hypothetical protein
MVDTRFNLNLIEDIPELEQLNLDTGRRYLAKDGSIPEPGYPSVTTVLGADKSNEAGLRKWRERVGEEEANKISFRATSRGTAVHQILEDYILGQAPKTKPMPIHMDMASGLKKFADRYIDNVRMVEGQIFSHHLRVAGTVDLVADFDGQPAIIDWKTANYPKKKNNINNYFKQESAYAVMFEERTGIPVKKLVTLVAYPDGTQMFVEDRDDWIDDFIQLREMYDSQLQGDA